MFCCFIINPLFANGSVVFIINPLYADGFFFLVRYNKLVIVHSIYVGCQDIIFKKYYFFCLLQIVHSAALHLGLHCF